jgi:hypothetical protein
LRCGMMTPVLTNGEAAENMAIAAGNGPKAHKFGLKEQAPVLVQRIFDSASSQIACGSYRSATQGARGRLCRKPAARPCRPFLCPTLGRGAGGRRPKLLQRPPIRPRLLTHDPHRHQRRGVREHSPNAPVSYENATNEHGERLIWLDRAVVERLRSLRGAGESYSDVILRLAVEG